MRLVIGGRYQGKRDAACRLFSLKPSDFADGKTCAFEDIFRCRAIFDFHEFIRRFMQPESCLQELSENLAERNPQICIVSNEIGCGVVPIDAQERAWRELTGRICCQLARNADTVVRVTAGIPMVIKGNLK